tara:strand:+ start:923 stop:2704 length:1782 start_codon:yes stop_codon:yes gene_type:complete
VPERIGGWQKLSSNTFLGTCRALKPFQALDGGNFLGLGTHLKYYLEQGGVYYDITPIRSTTSAGDVTFSATNGSSTITVTDTGHGAVDNDFVTFSGAASLGGNVTAAVLNQEYQVTRRVDDNSYEILAKDSEDAEVTANSSDSGNGGGSVVGTYQINVGLDVSVLNTGWGVGTWGRGTWGSSEALSNRNTLRLWSHDNFGEDLIINVKNGGIYYWDRSLSSSSFQRAVAISDRSGADSTTPTVARQVLISDVDRHVILFGCDPENNIGSPDPLLIRFSDQENPLVWQSLATNTAGDLRLGSGSEIITAIETRQQILVLTDTAAYAMQFIGPPFTFGINLISENITVIGSNAAKAVDDLVFWMGLEEFYVYNGQVQKLPCPIRSYIFDNFNDDQREKVFAALNSSYNEVWWFYPTASSEEIDKYAVYNYVEKVWYYGTLERTAWVDRGLNFYPIAASTTDHHLYDHEYLYDDGSTVPPSPITTFIESSQIDIGDGNNFMFIRRLIPDVTFSGSETDVPAVDFSLKTRNFPGGNFSETSTKEVARSATVPVEQFTDQAHVRLRGRSVAVRISSDIKGVKWRLGSPRIDIKPDGRR